jgi:Glycosyl transferase family 11
MLFCEVSPGGIGSQGLGNRLLPWARCVIFARSHNVPMLATRWAQLPIGSLLRRDAEPRIYANLFTRRKGEVGGWRRAYVRARAKKLAEPCNLSHTIPALEGLNLIVFDGLGGQFRPLQGCNEFVRQELLGITRRVWRDKAEAIPAPFVGIHVRRGDFQRMAPGADLSRTDNAITPLEWFIETLKLTRAQVSQTLPSVVTSDGYSDQLAALLKVDNVRLVSTGSAIGDLLLLSRSSLLLASGSSFSAWASYLGQMPTLSHPGQNLGGLFQLRGTANQFISEFDPSERLPPPLSQSIENSLASS